MNTQMYPFLRIAIVLVAGIMRCAVWTCTCKTGVLCACGIGVHHYCSVQEVGHPSFDDIAADA